MTGARPLVSIGLPVFNGERYLARALGSLLAQDYAPIEIVASDNGSTDRTPDILDDFARRDARLRVTRSPENHGAYWNVRRTLDLASGEYFMWAACDDLWDPGFVSAIAARLDAAPRAGVGMCAVERVGEDGRRRDLVAHEGRRDPNRMSSFALAWALAGGLPYHLFIYGLYRRALLAQAFTPLPAVAGSDRLFMCRVALATGWVYEPRTLHWRLVRTESLAARYGGETVGRVWRDRLARWRMVAAAGPFLAASPLVPRARKLGIPLLVARLAWWSARLSVLDAASRLVRAVRPRPA